MVDDVPSKQKDEGLPLLKVTAAGDTHETRALNNAVVTGAIPITAVWGDPLRGFPRNFSRSWRDRLPEYLSACWMTFILLGISFLIFYIAGLIVYRDQNLTVFKCNATKTDCKMYYHKIVYDHVHFSAYSEFLSIQAMKYPHVQHHIYFLFDDTNRDPLKRTLLYGKPIPNKSNVINKREIKSFQKRFGNTNITVMSLKEFFANSPMKDTWKSIPTVYLAFYARLCSVWKTGGIGIDLMKYNIEYSRSHKKLEHHIKEYGQKIKEVREQEKAQSKERNSYVGGGRVYVSYTLIRMDDLDNETKSISSAEPETKTTVITTRKLTTKKTNLGLNKTTDNNTFYYVDDGVFKEFNVTANTNETNIKALVNPVVPIESFSNQTAENNTVKKSYKVFAEVNVTTANNNEIHPTPDPIAMNSNKTAENISFQESNITAKGFNEIANEKNQTSKLPNFNNIFGELYKTLNQFNVSDNTNKTSIEMFPAFELLIRDPIEMMLMGMNDDQNTINSFKDMFSQQFDISVSGEGDKGPYFGQPNTLVLPVLAIDRCGLFIATVAPRHRLLEMIMKHKCNWAPPGFVIQQVMDNTCSSKFYDSELCLHTFIL